MFARRIVFASLMAGALALSVPLFAQKPANAPANATGQCNDNTFTTAKTQKGACSRHGGIKTFWGTATPQGATGATAAPPKAQTPPPPPPPKGTPTPTTQSTKANTTKPPAGTPENATAKCKDGTYSFAKQHKGACSHHGGVAEWYK